MGASANGPTGPNFFNGIAAGDVEEGKTLLGHVNGEAVFLTRRGGEVFALGNTCTHYGGPLNEGLVRGETIHCPWHHACFDLRTGAPHAPALNAIACWKVEAEGDWVYVREQRPPAAPLKTAVGPASVVIIGAGAAGHAAAEALRAEGYANPIVLLGTEGTVPIDRPNLSKDYLAGEAPAEWIPLRPPEFFAERKIDLRTNREVTQILPKEKTVVLGDGERIAYGALLIATGASPVRLPIPGAAGPRTHYLRTLADCDRIVAAAAHAKKAVVIGSGFIGLEVAASLRTRGLEVAVVGLEHTPLEKVMGAAVGKTIQALHESHGVVFYLSHRPASITETAVTLDDGQVLECDLVVIGVGVRPNVKLAEEAGLTVDNGIVVNSFLETGEPGIYAAGDVARWPSPVGEGTVRIEHWVVAQRHGQAAARNMLGKPAPYRTMPFFWSMHYDKAIRYAGVGAGFTEVRLNGSLESGEWTAVYSKEKQVIAVATMGRDRVNLQAEEALEKGDQAFLRALA